MTAPLLRTALPLLLLAVCGLVNAASPTLRIVLPMIHPSAQEHARYFPALLRLALDKTAATDGPYTIEHYPHELTSPRQQAEVRKDGVINVMWDGTNPQREHELLPVRVSLLRELNDYRVFLIRADQQERFRAVRTLDDLRQFKAGVGVNWPSADILRRNGLPVVTSISYESLFPMLALKRFDYLPRGAQEAWGEQELHAKEGLVVESTIFLHYHVPHYFFVSHANPELAARIERGLKLAQKDGSWDKLFNSIPALRRGQAEINARQRRVFELRMDTRAQQAR